MSSVDNVFASIQNNGPHLLSYNIRTKEAKYRDKTIDDISDELRKELEAFPEISKFVVTPGGMQGIGGGSTMEVDIFGHDFTMTDKLAADLKTRMEGIPGLRDVTISRKDYRMEYQIEFDREKLSLHGLSMATAAGAVRNRINGLTLSQFREDGEEYDIRVRYDEGSRESIEDIENIMVYDPMGVGIRVHDLGKVVEGTSLPEIDRQNRQRIVTVSGSIYNRALSEISADVNKILSTMEIPSGAHMEISGSVESQQEAFSELGLLLVIVSLLVYIVMASQFESLTYPFRLPLSVLC